MISGRGPASAECASTFQLAVVNDCQMPFRFGFPSSVRATPAADPCPGRDTVNQSAAATIIPAAASMPIDPLLITSLYFPIPAGPNGPTLPTKNRAAHQCA